MPLFPYYYFMVFPCLFFRSYFSVLNKCGHYLIIISFYVFILFHVILMKWPNGIKKEISKYKKIQKYVNFEQWKIKFQIFVQHKMFIFVIFWNSVFPYFKFCVGQSFNLLISMIFLDLCVYNRLFLHVPKSFTSNI